MVSCDTNVLFAASNPGDAKHAEACAFVESHVDDPHFVIAEQTLMELYCQLLLAADLGYISEEDVKVVKARVFSVTRMLSRLRASKISDSKK